MSNGSGDLEASVRSPGTPALSMFVEMAKKEAGLRALFCFVRRRKGSERTQLALECEVYQTQGLSSPLTLHPGISRLLSWDSVAQCKAWDPNP